MNVDKIPCTLYWKNNCLTILDQTALPHKVIYEKQTDIDQMWQSIYKLKVRGAPAIGVAAAYGVLTGMFQKTDLPLNEFKALLMRNAAYLSTSRPTAVNLARSIRRIRFYAEKSRAEHAFSLYEELVQAAKDIHREDRELCRLIGENGAPLITEGCAVLTHCNAGALATSGIGTALAPIYTASCRGVRHKVYVDETRPLLQGARLTAWELSRSGVDTMLLCDNMAADLMSKGLINLVIVGCDRVAANGDTANKIGTLAVAVLSRHFKIPFYVACPSSTIDFEAASGEAIPIEMRDPDEVRYFNGVLAAEESVKAYNPAFDLTPAELITGFITEKGIIYPPYDRNLYEFFYEQL